MGSAWDDEIGADGWAKLLRKLYKASFRIN